MEKITEQLGAVWTWSTDDNCYVLTYNGYKCYSEDGTLITMNAMDKLEEGSICVTRNKK